MRLSHDQRLYMIRLFYDPKFNIFKNKYEDVCQEAHKQGIHYSSVSLRALIKKWQEKSK